MSKNDETRIHNRKDINNLAKQLMDLPETERTYIAGALAMAKAMHASTVRQTHQKGA